MSCETNRKVSIIQLSTTLLEFPSITVIVVVTVLDIDVAVINTNTNRCVMKTVSDAMGAINVLRSSVDKLRNKFVVLCHQNNQNLKFPHEN